MKKSVIGSVMVAEVALMVSVMAINANSNQTRGQVLMSQANQKQISVSAQHADKAKQAHDGKTYQILVKR